MTTTMMPTPAPQATMWSSDLETGETSNQQQNKCLVDRSIIHLVQDSSSSKTRSRWSAMGFVVFMVLMAAGGCMLLAQGGSQQQNPSGLSSSTLRSVKNDRTLSTFSTREEESDDYEDHQEQALRSTPCLTTLFPEESLSANQHICSPNGRYKFGLDANSDLSLWDGNTRVWSGETSSMVQGAAGAKLVMKNDGNAIFYGPDGGTPLWRTGTSKNGGATLVIEDDGLAKVRSSSGELLWRNGVCGYLKAERRTVATEERSTTQVDASTIHKKIMAGYQGWFSTSCDGADPDWKHWSGDKLNPSNIGFDMWPDMREVENDELCPTELKYKDGTNAGVWSSYNIKTVDRHVKWMKDYGIDGVYVQRFLLDIRHHKCERDKVLDDMRLSAEKYGRVFANMYDISLHDPETMYDDLKNDWMHLVDDLKVTESDRYLRHNGKPVLSIWGFGFATRPGDPAKVAELMDWFQNSAEEKYRVTLKGGVPSYWRTLGKDSKGGSEWADIYRKFDIISPWNVGRYGNDGADNFKTEMIEPDLAECKKHGIEYLPVVFPGFSFSNHYPDKPFNEIPRRGGRFFWQQLFNAVDVGNTQVYVAMFDEVDEGTAIFKTAENSDQIPDNGNFLTLDADGENVPSDWYLRLTGWATRMLRESGALTKTMPTSDPGSAEPAEPTDPAEPSPESCLRTVSYGVNPAETKGFKLKVCDPTDSSSCIQVSGSSDDDDIARDTVASSAFNRQRYFTVSLPQGSYEAVFLDQHDDEVWPTYVETVYGEATCSNALTEGSISLKPTPLFIGECDELIKNGNAEFSNDEHLYWLQRNGGIKVVPGDGIDGSNAFSDIERSNKDFDAIVQYLDTRCLGLEEGSKYEITAWVKLTDNSNGMYKCDPSTEDCPEAQLQISNIAGEDRDIEYTTVGEAVKDEFTSEGYQLVKGAVEITPDIVGAARVLFMLKRNKEDLQMSIDNVSMARIG